MSGGGSRVGPESRDSDRDGVSEGDRAKEGARARVLNRVQGWGAGSRVKGQGVGDYQRFLSFIL